MNYSIEGNIDFYKELLESVCETTLDEKKDEKQEDELCLITQQPLEEHFIVLDCNHKFNYLPLFHEVKRQKSKQYVCNQYDPVRLKINEIKCPYCRQVQPKLLPYVKIPGNLTISYGVTFPEKYRMDRIKCPAIFKSGKRKGQRCGKGCSKSYGFCKLHMKSNKKSENKNKEICGCEQILKSGKRKGEKCNLKIFNNNLCKRHFNMTQK